MSEDLRVQKKCAQVLTSFVKDASDVVAAQTKMLMDKFPNASDLRKAVLFGTVRKLQESTKAILVLGRSGFPDEMNVLLRTEVELVINSCSLQHSSEKEVQRYVSHDAINSFIAMKSVEKANTGIGQVPPDLVERVTRYAEEANSASGVPLDSHWWHSETTGLKQRARLVDETIGVTDFVGLLASVYVVGSGYTHAGYKTIHKHIYELRTGKKEHTLATSFHINNAIHGTGYVLLVLGRYLSKQFDLPLLNLDQLARDAVRAQDIGRQDFRLYREEQKRQGRQN